MTSDPERVELRVSHLDCEAEAAQLRRGLAAVPGVSQLEVLPRAGRVRLTLDPAATSREAVQRRLAELGFPVLERPDAPQLPPPWRNPRVVTSAASGVLLLLGYALARLGAPDVIPVRADVERGRVLALAAAVEAHSEHPLARAIMRAAEREGVRAPAASDFQFRTGVGATARADGALVSIGSLRALEESPDAEEAQRLTAPLRQQGKSIVVVSLDGQLAGVIGLRDDLRPEARAAIAELRAAGIRRVVMLSGDHALTAQAIGAQAGVDEVQADLRPEAKVEPVRTLAREHGGVLMVGDGVNDAPALAAATVGVAMGVAGTDVALETADVALMGDDLRKLAYANRIVKQTRRVVRQNLALSSAVIAVLVVGAVTGSFGLPAAALAHEVSELVVIASGLRLVRGPGRSTGAAA